MKEHLLKKYAHNIPPRFSDPYDVSQGSPMLAIFPNVPTYSKVLITYEP